MKYSPRDCLIEIFQAGLEAVAPGPALRRHAKLQDNTLLAGGSHFKLPDKGVYVVGGGKGAAPMAMALENLLGDKIREGVIVVKYGHELELDRIQVLQAAHPVPDEAGLEGAQACLELARKCGPGDLLICLLTGGASALLPAPAESLELSDLQALTSLLLASGADIEEINAVRKHLSALSGGRLVQAANGASILTLIVSDVMGDDPSSIASGPTSPDPSTFADCLAIIEKYALKDRLDPRIFALLGQGAAGSLPETPKADNELFEKVANVIIASNRQALEAAAKKASELGLDVRIMEQAMHGEASLWAAYMIRQAEEIQKSLSPDDKAICLLAGGETTVSLTGSGKGGRNQEMALAASIELEGKEGIFCLFAGTDGTDGPTDAAGGFADGEALGKMGGRLQGEKYLKEHDSYEALKISANHYITGPTRTNVMDMAIIIVEAIPEKQD